MKPVEIGAAAFGAVATGALADSVLSMRNGEPILHWIFRGAKYRGIPTTRDCCEMHRTVSALASQTWFRAGIVAIGTDGTAFGVESAECRPNYLIARWLRKH